MTEAFLCPGCGTLWSKHQGRPVKSMLVWSETEQRHVWVLNARRGWCASCQVKTPTQRSRSRA